MRRVGAKEMVKIMGLEILGMIHSGAHQDFMRRAC